MRSSDAECLGDSAEAVSEDGYVALSAGAVERRERPRSRGMPWAACTRRPSSALAAVQSTTPTTSVRKSRHARRARHPTPGRRGRARRSARSSPRSTAARRSPSWRALGKRLYALALPHDQAGVAWSHYQLRKAALEAAVMLGAPARSAHRPRSSGASERELPRAGRAALPAAARQGSAAIATAEWRRIWQAYQRAAGRAPRRRTPPLRWRRGLRRARCAARLGRERRVARHRARGRRRGLRRACFAARLGPDRAYCVAG